MQNKETIVPLEIEDFIEKNGDVFFFARDFNALFRLIKGEKTARLLCSIRGEKCNGVRLYPRIFEYKNKIVLVPFAAKELAIYDMSIGKIRKIKLPQQLIECPYRFMVASQINCNLFLFAAYLPHIYLFDIDREELKLVCDWKDKLPENAIFDGGDSYFRYQTLFHNGRIYVPFCNANALLAFDPQICECEIKILDDKKIGYSGIAYYEGYFYCSPRLENTEGVRIDIESDRIEYLKLAKGIPVGIAVRNGKYKYYTYDAYAFVKNENRSISAFEFEKNNIVIIEEGQKREYSTMSNVDCAMILRIANQEKRNLGLREFLSALTR